MLFGFLTAIADSFVSKLLPSRAFSTVTDQMSSSVSIRPFSGLGGANHGWLNTRHHFSFADYYDPIRMNWGSLRVINDDIITPGAGFPPHPHRNMEIITYMLKQNLHPATNQLEGGEGIRHRDNTGSDGITEPGNVQVMSVGRDGVAHSEFHPNAKSKHSANLFQIWITPDVSVKETTWGTREFPHSEKNDDFVIFASGFPEDKGTALHINSLSRVAGVNLESGQVLRYKLGKNRLAYAVVSSGSVTVNGKKAGSHDGIAIKDTEELTFDAGAGGADILLIDTHP